MPLPPSKNLYGISIVVDGTEIGRVDNWVPSNTKTIEKIKQVEVTAPLPVDSLTVWCQEIQRAAARPPSRVHLGLPPMAIAQGEQASAEIVDMWWEGRDLLITTENGQTWRCANAEVTDVTHQDHESPEVTITEIPTQTP